MASKRVTMREVAMRSGVSSQTVSRVINGDVHVSKKTRQQVLDVIDALNYRPNRAAQSLVTNQSNIIEVITFGANHYGPAQTLTNINAKHKAWVITSSIQPLSIPAGKKLFTPWTA